MPEPPSCTVKVYAKDSPDTEEIFHYLVPLKGVNNPEKITIHLSLRSSPVAGTLHIYFLIIIILITTCLSICIIFDMTHALNC